MQPVQYGPGHYLNNGMPYTMAQAQPQGAMNNYPMHIYQGAWQPYPNPAGIAPVFPQPQGNMYSQNNVQPASQQNGHFLFQNPLEAAGGQGHLYNQQMQFTGMNQYMPMNPYPKKSMMPKQPGAMQSILGSFKSQDGSLDINKMVNTAGQAINAVSQASALIKGIGGALKV